MNIKYTNSGKHKIVSIYEEIDFYIIGEFKRTITEIIDNEDITSLVLDLQNNTNLNSAFIGTLVALKIKMEKINGRFTLLNVSNDAKSIFELASLDNFFTIINSVSELDS